VNRWWSTACYSFDRLTGVIGVNCLRSRLQVPPSGWTVPRNALVVNRRACFARSAGMVPQLCSFRHAQSFTLAALTSSTGADGPFGTRRRIVSGLVGISSCWDKWQFFCNVIRGPRVARQKLGGAGFKVRKSLMESGVHHYSRRYRLHLPIQDLLVSGAQLRPLVAHGRVGTS
jgi:hypothetical protein